MSADAMLHVRLDEKTKTRAAKVLNKMGLSMSDAVRLLFTRVAEEKAMPFEIRVPNKRTQKTLESSDRNENVVECESKEALFRELGLNE